MHKSRHPAYAISDRTIQASQRMPKPDGRLRGMVETSSLFNMGFSLFYMTPFFVFRKTESCETKTPCFAGGDNINDI